MSNEPASVAGSGRILLIAPAPPPSGGMALQAKLLERLLREDGQTVAFFASNFPLSGSLAVFEGIPGLRTALRAVLIWVKLWKAVRQADVIHVFAASWLYFFTVVCPALVTGRLCGCRLVLNYRGGEAGLFFQRWGTLVGPFLRLPQVLTAPSGFLADTIWRRFQVPVEIVPNVLDGSVFQFRRRSIFCPKLLVTRNLEPMYGVETVLRAYRLVEERHPEASLWIAGSGGEEARLRALAAEWKLRNVRFLGHVSHRDLPGIYDQCDIFVNGSRVDNFPGALLEASAAGLAVVSTTAGGIPFMYTNERTALLVPLDDGEAMSAAVERVLQEPCMALQMVEEAARIAKGCQWSQARRALYRTYGFSVDGGLPAVCVNTNAGEV